MYDHISIIQHQPAFTGLAFHAAFFLIILFCGFEHALGQRVEHTLTGTVADDEVVGKRRYIFNIKKQDVLALFVLQGLDNLMCKF